ncbi:MAG: hypothetical protein AAGG02_11745 [Cyanobacteria bacterium P01_H01_bin.15]
MADSTHTVEFFWEGGNILNDKDRWFKGAGEIYFKTRVTILGRSANLHTARFPKEVYTLHEGPYEINQTLFKGSIQNGEEVLLEVFPIEKDLLDPDDKFVPYRRRFLRSPERWAGLYEPGTDSIGDRETMRDWQIRYRVHVS